MARALPGWERLLPSKGESGRPGWRLLSHDGESLQSAIYRKNEGAWKDASLHCDWRSRDQRWHIFLIDAQDRHIGPAYGEHFGPAVQALNEQLVDRGLPPIT